MPRKAAPVDWSSKNPFDYPPPHGQSTIQFGPGAAGHCDHGGKQRELKLVHPYVTLESLPVPGLRFWHFLCLHVYTCICVHIHRQYIHIYIYIFFSKFTYIYIQISHP